MPLFFKRKLNWRKLVLASLIFLVTSFIIRQIEVVLTMKYYVMPEYFGVWSKIMMPKAGPPPPEFFIVSLIFTILSGLVLAYIYEWIKNSLPKTFWMKVLAYSKLIILLNLILSYMPMYLMMNVPLALIASWFVSSSIIVFISAIGFVKILK